jgi:hypothetical protein
MKDTFLLKGDTAMAISREYQPKNNHMRNTAAAEAQLLLT